MTDDERHRILDEAVAKLAEHFDVVQILVSWTDDRTTYAKKAGSGNWYARRGMAEEFVDSSRDEDLASRIAKAQEPPPDESESWKDK